jgi:hypothetical protein
MTTISLLTRDDVINSALRKLLVLGEQMTASALQLNNCTTALNVIISQYRALGMSVWKRVDYTMPLITGQDTYVFGIGQANNTAYPLHVYQARFQSPPYDTQIDVNILSFPDYNLLPNSSSGVTVNLNYQPGINQGTFRIWPTPDATVPAGSRLVLTYQAPFELTLNASETLDFPQEYQQAVIYALAVSMADEYGVPEQKKVWLEKQADKHLMMALSNGAEDGSLFLQPDYQGN